MKNIKSIISLTVIAAVISVLLSLTNYLTEPIIKKQADASTNAALLVVLPGGENFEKIDISKYELPQTITEAYSEDNGGFVFKMTTTGYASNFVVMCGIDNSGTVKGTTTISSSETLGAEDTYGEQLKDKTAETIENVATVSGATKTTLAFRNAVKDALNAFIILNGGSVDLRDEAQILNDILSIALPSAEGKFTKVFVSSVLTDVSDVYAADNGTGYVFKMADSFIATDAQGNVLTEVDEQVKITISSNASLIINEKLTEIDISAFADMPSNILKAYKTTSGNYVLDLRAAGYGINGGNEWHPASGEYIYIKLSATPDGQIINCETVSQKESDGIGSPCGDSAFYSQFNGKTNENYTEIDAISGATITTDGYKNAIAKAFDAIKILKGE